MYYIILYTIARGCSQVVWLKGDYNVTMVNLLGGNIPMQLLLNGLFSFPHSINHLSLYLLGEYSVEHTIMSKLAIKLHSIYCVAYLRLRQENRRHIQ